MGLCRQRSKSMSRRRRSPPARTGALNRLRFPLGLESAWRGATLKVMTQQPATKIQLLNTPEYRENYANSVQVRVNLWDFFLSFGRVNQTAPDTVAIHNFQGVYVSPQQAKALLNVLRENITQYESAFGEIRLEPQAGTSIVQ